MNIQFKIGDFVKGDARAELGPSSIATGTVVGFTPEGKVRVLKTGESSEVLHYRPHQLTLLERP